MAESDMLGLHQVLYLPYQQQFGPLSVLALREW